MTHSSSLHTRHLPRPADSGFTLIEMIVAMAVSSLILIAALTAFDGSRRISRRNFALTDAQQSGTYALQELALNVRRAGFGSGGAFAIVRNAGLTPDANGTVNSPLATWNNYNAGLTTIATSGPSQYIPVPGTDGITIRYADSSKAPLHVCYAPDANHLDLATNTNYMSAALRYPYDGGGSQPVFDLVTANVACYGGTNYAATNQGRVTVTAVNFGQSCNQGAIGLPPPNSVNTVDLACRNAIAGTTTCTRVTLAGPGLPPGPLACGVANAVTGSPSVLLYPSRTVSYWISTEDRLGNIANSPPVLVSRTSGTSSELAQPLAENNILTATTRVLANGVEDLQLVFYRADTAFTPNVLRIHDSSILPPTATTPNVMPTNLQMPEVRAIRIDLITRTGVTDLMYKTNAFCSAAARPANFKAVFSRPELDDHAAAVAGADYCDGFRRLVLTQLVNMPNMSVRPNG